MRTVEFYTGADNTNFFTAVELYTGAVNRNFIMAVEFYIGVHKRKFNKAIYFYTGADKKFVKTGELYTGRIMKTSPWIQFYIG